MNCDRARAFFVSNSTLMFEKIEKLDWGFTLSKGSVAKIVHLCTKTWMMFLLNPMEHFKRCSQYLPLPPVSLT